MKVQVVRVGDVEIGGGKLAIMAGPCVIETLEMCLEVAKVMKDLTTKYGFGYIFKSSFEKDNRSSAQSYSGPGLDEGLKVLEEVKKKVGVPVLSDVHCSEQVDRASQVLDMIQIPAYLCQQTRLALRVGRAGKPVNVKKGQFVAPEDMKAVVGKIRSTGNHSIVLTERGTCFGYRRLVVDMRSFPIMRAMGCPVVFDATHAVRLYGYPSSDPQGGEPQFIAPLARAAVACGLDGLFLEVHPNPSKALCDASSMLSIDEVDNLLSSVAALDRALKRLG